MEKLSFYMTKKKKNEQNFYFTKEVQDDIVKYAETDSKDLKNELYKNSIGKTLKELIDNVVQVYKLGNLPNISFLKEECLLYLISVLSKFDKNKGSKAYTYFTVITKHWFFFQFRKNKKQSYQEIEIDEFFKSSASSELSVNNSENLITYNDYESLRESHEFKTLFLKEIEDWKKEYNSDKVSNLINAITFVFENYNNLDFLSKKGIFVYLREISGLETKEISSIIKKLSPLLKNFQKKWNAGDI